jgi:hypothetical protein
LEEQRLKKLSAQACACRRRRRVTIRLKHDSIHPACPESAEGSDILSGQDSDPGPSGYEPKSCLRTQNAEKAPLGAPRR